MFFNIGGGELLVIAMVALIAVGPEQLPSVLRKIGKGVAQIRSMTAGLRDEFMSGIDEVTDVVDPAKWTGSGSGDDPVVPRGYAKQQQSGEGATPPGADAPGSGTPGSGTPAVGAESGNGSGDDVVVNKIAQANARSSAAPRAASPRRPDATETAATDRRPDGTAAGGDPGGNEPGTDSAAGEAEREPGVSKDGDSWSAGPGASSGGDAEERA